MKRAFDVVMAAFGILLLAPLFVAIGIAVIMGSGWPVLFRQQRVGKGGRDFTLLKFRTMTALAGSEKGSFDAGSGRRVTPVGRFLRKSKLDELPQLWNVLRGDMSLVGPRPEVRKWVEAYPERWAYVHTVRPGITDPASIAFRNEEEILARSTEPERTYREEVLPSKLALYEKYVRARSFVGDLKVLAETFGAVLFARGSTPAGTERGL